MRVYEGGPRQDYEEALRAIGALLDERGMREILIAETRDGFLVQGLVTRPRAEDRPWVGGQPGEKETFTFADEDIAAFVEEAHARRRSQQGRGDRLYEDALRVVGGYIDQQAPRDIFFFEQDGAFVLRLLMGTQAGPKHVIVEFTRPEIDEMVGQRLAERAGERDESEEEETDAPPPPDA